MNKQVNKYINNYCKCISKTKNNNSSKVNASISPSKLLIENSQVIQLLEISS